MTVVNFNKAKKARDKREKRARADENAARFGRTKAEKQADNRAAERASAHLDRHKLNPEEQE